MILHRKPASRILFSFLAFNRGTVTQGNIRDMKEPRSKAGASAKATRESKVTKAARPAAVTKAARPASATKAASVAGTATVTRLPTGATAATRRRATSGADHSKEIDSLRREVEKLRKQLAAFNEKSAPVRDTQPAPEEAHPWLRIAATVGVTFAIGKLMQVLRVPAAAAVAVPMITAELNRRIL